MDNFNTNDDNFMLSCRNDFVTKTFLRMGLGLLITMLSSWYTHVNSQSFGFLLNTNYGLAIVIIAQLCLVIFLGARLNKMSLATAKFCYYGYALLSGITFSFIFDSYNLGTIYTAFGFSAMMFLASALVGKTTNKDLSVMGRFFLMSLIGLIIITIIEAIFPMPALNIGISIAGIIIFAGLTAYDTQKIYRHFYNIYDVDSENFHKYSIYAALDLYLDFINMFLYILRLFGGKGSSKK